MGRLASQQATRSRAEGSAGHCIAQARSFTLDDHMCTSRIPKLAAVPCKLSQLPLPAESLANRILGGFYTLVLLRATLTLHI